MDRAVASEAKGRGFESLRMRQDRYFVNVRYVMLSFLKKATCFLLVFSILLLTACNDGEIKKEGGNDSKKHYYITPTPFTEKKDDGINTGLKLCDVEMVRLLAASYFAALKSGDADKLSPLVTDPDSIKEGMFAHFKNAESINVRHVYQLDGQTPLDYVIYVYYEVKFKDIETAVPSLDELFVTRKEDKYYVMNGPVPAIAYNNVLGKINAEAGVKELIESVNRLFEKALDSDEALRAYIEGSRDENSSLSDDNL